MRPTLPAERSIARALFVLTFFAYGYFFGGGGWGTNAHLDLTRSLVERGTVEVNAYATNTGDVAQLGERVLINKPPGVSFLGVAVYAPLYWLERALGLDPAHATTLLANGYAVNLFVSALPGAMIPPLIFLYGRKKRELSYSFALSLAFIASLATQLWGSATLILVHVPSGAFLFLAWYAMERKTRSGDLLAGAAVGIAALCNYMAMPVVLLFAIAIALHREDDRLQRIVRFGIGGLPMAIAFVMYQYSAFGGIFKMPISMNERFVTKKSWFGLIDPPSFDAFWGITFSKFRGLFYVSPILILALVGLVLIVRRRKVEEWLPVIGAVAIFFAINVTFNNWDGGFGVGARYVIPIVPFLVVLMMEVKLKRAIWMGLGAVSFANNLVITAVDAQPSGTFIDPLGQYLWPLFLTGRFNGEDIPLHPHWSPELYTGHVGVVRHALDEIVPFTHHRPGSAVSEWASFNLGEFLFGRASLLSLLPLLVVMAGAAIALYRRARGLDREGV